MHEPIARTPLQTAIAFARVSAALDALTGIIAGFALLAGARAFMFIALLGWREPVLGGAGLVLLAMVGWLRWRCGGIAAAHPAPRSRATMHRAGGPCAGAAMMSRRMQPPCTDVLDVACYNRPSQCDAAARPGATVKPASCGPART